MTAMNFQIKQPNTPSKTGPAMNEHTLTQLRSLRLDGMVRALEEQATSTAASALGFDERFSLVVQRQVSWRDERRVAFFGDGADPTPVGPGKDRSRFSGPPSRVCSRPPNSKSVAPACKTLIGAPAGHWIALW